MNDRGGWPAPSIGWVSMRLSHYLFLYINITKVYFSGNTIPNIPERENLVNVKQLAVGIAIGYAGSSIVGAVVSPIAGRLPAEPFGSNGVFKGFSPASVLAVGGGAGILLGTSFEYNDVIAGILLGYAGSELMKKPGA